MKSKKKTPGQNPLKRNKWAFLKSHWVSISMLLMVYDTIVVNLSYFLALWFRFDCNVSSILPPFLARWQHFIPLYSVICLVAFLLFKLYQSLWRFASYSELIRLIFATLTTAALHTVLMLVFFGRMPISYFIVGAFLQFLFLLGARFSYRFLLLLRRPRMDNPNVSRVMLIGAGNSGQIILRDVQLAKETRDRVVCIIDDNPNKWNRYIDGIPIVGGRDCILASVEKYRIQKIYVALPSASAEDRREILNICKETDCELRILPGMYEFALGKVSVSEMKKVSVEDLLGREPIRTNMQEVYDFISGKVVLVTGGGGSIGSELCRQIAKHHPKQLIIFEIYENNAYDIQNDLLDEYPDLNLVTLIGSVRDSRRIFQVFEEYRPQIVYQAAAHKHVPLMEASPNEAIKNNAIGTYKTAYAAMAWGCERFVLISTDKAVNPTNIMGASKRLCEMIIQSFDEKIKAGRARDIPQLFTHMEEEKSDAPTKKPDLDHVKTEFVAVRFGNVLGSNGSVVPLFKKWIEKGGPIKVTHPDIIRYFMTIPEAVSLVLLAGTYAHGGEIFVLDMGSPMKIDTLARNLILLSGYKPDIDIKIIYTGLRPGEKLYEEKLMAEEGLKKTDNDLIHIGCPIPFDVDQFLEQLEELMKCAYSNRRDITALVQKMVSTYHPTTPDAAAHKDSHYRELVQESKQ